jgi:hypothetical protein
MSTACAARQVRASAGLVRALYLWYTLEPITEPSGDASGEPHPYC